MAESATTLAVKMTPALDTSHRESSTSLHREPNSLNSEEQAEGVTNGVDGSND